MAFDIKTAKPISGAGGFDISTAKPIEDRDDPSFLPGHKKAEELIKNRSLEPSAVDVLRKEVLTPYDFIQHPFKSTMKPLVTGLKTLNVPIEKAESAVANVGMKMQEGIFNPVTLAKEGYKGITGERRGQLGDITRKVNVPEPFSSAIGFFATMKGINPATKGKLIKSANEAENFIKSKLPVVMNKNYMLDRATKAASGLDELYTAVSKEYEIIYDKIGKLQVPLQDVQSVIDDLPENIIRQISKSKLLSRSASGDVVPDMNNLKIIKGIIKKSVPDKIWSGKAIGDMNTAALEQLYGKINSIMSKNSPELQELNSRYGDFKQMQKTINRILYDADGNIQAGGLSRLFGKGGERGKQVFFEKFANQWPQAKQIIKDTQKFNKRQSFKKGAGTALKFGIGAEAARRFIVNPFMESIQNR